MTLVGNPDFAGPLRSSRDALGARVRVSADLDGSSTIDPGEIQIREVTSGSGCAASTCTLQLHFGLGEATTANVRVFWPSGRETRATLAADQAVTLNEGDSHPKGLYQDQTGGMTPASAK